MSCSVCFDSLDSSTKRLACGHVFHRGCITQWFVRSETCPLCRTLQKNDPMIKSKRNPFRMMELWKSWLAIRRGMPQGPLEQAWARAVAHEATMEDLTGPLGLNELEASEMMEYIFKKF